MHEHVQQEPIHINLGLPFAPIDLFFPVIAALAACFGRCDGLGVQDTDGRLCIATQRVSRQFAQRIIDVDMRFHRDSMCQNRIEPNASAEHRSDACAIGSPCDGCPAGR